MSTQALDGLRRPGWLTFAAVILVSVGFLRIISAIYYFADSSRVNNLSGGAFGRRSLDRLACVDALRPVDFLVFSSASSRFSIDATRPWSGSSSRTFAARS